MNLNFIYGYISLAICFLAFNSCLAQNQKNACIGKVDSVLHKFVYTKVDENPEPVGGLKNLYSLLNKNFKYPPGDVEYSGKVIIAFVVEANGKINGKRVVNDPSGKDQLFGRQLMNIIDMIKWKPGKCSGKPVAVLYSFPLRVDLAE